MDQIEDRGLWVNGFQEWTVVKKEDCGWTRIDLRIDLREESGL